MRNLQRSFKFVLQYSTWYLRKNDSGEHLLVMAKNPTFNRLHAYIETPFIGVLARASFDTTQDVTLVLSKCHNNIFVEHRYVFGLYASETNSTELIVNDIVVAMIDALHWLAAKL